MTYIQQPLFKAFIVEDVNYKQRKLRIGMITNVDILSFVLDSQCLVSKYVMQY
ncbi:hypothetical protein QG37_00952 [Candidozyma auris]|nr:hypothetical protein QG37_00952 [[Candida] auris]